MATGEASIVAVATIVLILLPGLFLNGIFLFMYGRRYKLRIPAVYFLVSLCVVNIICLLIWIVGTVIAQFGYTNHLDLPVPFNAYCQIQAFFLVFYQSIHMHTFCLLAMERVLKFYKPRLHTEVFYNDIVVIVALVVMWLLEMVPALFHAMTWGNVIYFTDQYQCNYNDAGLTWRLNAMFMYTYILPSLFTLLCFVCVFAKYSTLKNKAVVNPINWNDDVMEVDLVGDGGSRMKAGNNQGRHILTNDDDSDEEIAYNSIFAVRTDDDDTKEDTKLSLRVYKYREREIEFALLIFVTWLVYLTLWLIYNVVIYMRAYDPIFVTSPTSALPSGLETAGTFLSHSSMSLCACLYWLINRRYRRHLRLACNCPQNRVEPPAEPKLQKIYPQPEYRRDPRGPQVKNIHSDGLGDFNNE